MSDKKTKKENKTKQKKERVSLIGGQALMEGVLMRGKTSEAMAVRAPDGEIALQTRRLPTKGQWYKKVPVVRGVVAFAVSLISGMSALMQSAKISGEEDETPGGGAMAIAVLLGIVLAVGLFILLPSFLTSLIEKAVTLWAWLSGLIEGVIRIIIFVLYLLIVSRMKDIRRTFMYHGAEHRTINCYEKGLDMTVENVQKCSTRHNRCGTTFLFLVVVISILVFALTNWLLSLTGLRIMGNMFVRMGVRILLLPIVAGVSYEVLRLLAALPDNAFTNALRAPGLALQRLTTYPPDDAMAQVALKSFLAVLEMDGNENIKPVKFFERDIETVGAEFKQMLEQNGIDKREYDWMLAEVIGLKKGQRFEITRLAPDDYVKLKGYVKRRSAGEPLDYILGHTEFCGNDIKVTNAVLCPRPETELLAERAVKYIGDRQLRVLDLCTGSGCIARALANTKASVTASDVSSAALEIARANLAGTGATVAESDMFAELDGKFDLIVTNPPYIKSADVAALSDTVKYEPELALDGGGDGLKFYRIIADNLDNYLADGGALMAEIGFDIGDAVKSLFADKFQSVTVEKDYASLDRFLIALGKKTGEAK